MSAALNDNTVFDYNDLIRLFDGGETVRNHQRGTVFLQLIQRGLNRTFRFGIQRGRSFIKDQNRAVAQ